LQLGIALVAALLLPTLSQLFGHEIPNDVTVRAFVRPEGTTLRLLVRVPLNAMRDFDFPLHGPGYLDISAAQPMLRDAATMWIADYVELYEDDAPLGEAYIVAARVSLPSDPSFASYPNALAHVTDDPLPDDTELYWEQAVLDVLLEYAIESDRSDFSIHPAWSHLGLKTMTVLRFLPAGGAERVFQYTGDPGRVRLDPRLHQAVWPHRDVVHRCAFHNANCLRSRSRARRSVVSAVDRNIDCFVYRVHGGGEHHRGQASPAVDHRVRVWARSRIRLLVRAE
jgi:hypothetical protein